MSSIPALLLSGSDNNAALAIHFAVRERALRQLRKQELQNLSDDDALKAIDTLLELGASHGWRRPERERAEGLVERQKLLYGIP